MKYQLTKEPNPIAVLALDELCFPHDDRVVLNGSLWWIVWRGKEAVGYAGLRVCQNPCNEGVAFLCRVGVLKEHRGNGLQKRLIRARERAAKAMNIRQLVTYCVPWNCASINSLIACGYKLYRPATKYGGAGAIYLQKRIS